MNTLIAPAITFICHALIYISLFSRLPEIAYELGISKGKIGAIMLCSALGVLALTPFAGRIVKRLTPPVAIMLCLSLLALFGPLITIGNIWALAALFLCFGAVNCVQGVAENLLALRIEKDTGKKILARSHGFWSVGMIIGTLWASFLQSQSVSPFVHTSITFVVVVIAQIGVWQMSPKEWPCDKKAAHITKARVHPTPAIILLCCTLWGLILLEGANNDWALFYLQEVNNLTAAASTLVFTFMSVGMLVVRMMGDSLRSAYSDTVILRASALCGICAIFLLLSTSGLLLSCLAMLMMGCAVALIFPTGVALASTRSGMEPSAAIAAFSATLTLGHIAVPPAMGFIADAWGLPYVFGILIVPILATFALAAKVAKPR